MPGATRAMERPRIARQRGGGEQDSSRCPFCFDVKLYLLVYVRRVFCEIFNIFISSPFCGWLVGCVSI